MATDINLPIYLDYASTTPVDPRVAKKISDHLTLDGNFGNPASRSHKLAGKQKKRLRKLGRMLQTWLVVIPEK